MSLPRKLACMGCVCLSGVALAYATRDIFPAPWGAAGCTLVSVFTGMFMYWIRNH